MSSRLWLSEEESWAMADLILNTLSFNRIGLESHTEYSKSVAKGIQLLLRQEIT